LIYVIFQSANQLPRTSYYVIQSPISKRRASLELLGDITVFKSVHIFVEHKVPWQFHESAIGSLIDLPQMITEVKLN